MKQKLKYPLLVGALVACSSTGSKKEPSENAIAEFLGIDTFEGRSAYELRKSEAIAVCMKKQGFDYVAYSNVRRISDTSGSIFDELKSDGYGFANSLRSRPTEDPNQVKFKALDNAQKEEYVRALTGTEGAGGCQLEADGGLEGRKVKERVGPKIRKSKLLIEQDPRIRAINNRWSSCMREMGYSVDNRQEVVPKLLQPLLTGSSINEDQDRQEDISGRDYQEESDNSLELIAELESKIAQADLNCSDEKDEIKRSEISREIEMKVLESESEDFEQLRRLYKGPQ
jgi:hypothetical protein